MFCGLNKKKKHCLISYIENVVAKILSVKFSFLLSILWGYGLSDCEITRVLSYKNVVVSHNMTMCIDAPLSLL